MRFAPSAGRWSLATFSSRSFGSKYTSFLYALGTFDLEPKWLRVMMMIMMMMMMMMMIMMIVMMMMMITQNKKTQKNAAQDNNDALAFARGSVFDQP